MDNFNEKLLGCCPIAKENPIDLDKSGLRSKKLEDGDHERLVDFIMEEFVFDERMAFVSSKSKEKLGEDLVKNELKSIAKDSWNEIRRVKTAYSINCECKDVTIFWYDWTPGYFQSQNVGGLRGCHCKNCNKIDTAYLIEPPIFCVAETILDIEDVNKIVKIIRDNQRKK